MNPSQSARSVYNVVRRVLLIFIGDTGIETAKRVIREQGIDMRFARMLILNTDMDQCPADLLPFFQELNKVRAQRIQRSPEHFPKFRQHLRLEKIEDLGDAPGTTQSINQGNLLFLASAPEIWLTVEALLRQLNSPNLLTLAEEDDLLLSEGIYVIVVRHTGGGTGSGPMNGIMSLVAQAYRNVVGHDSEINLVDLVLAPESYISFTNMNAEKANANAAVFLANKMWNARLALEGRQAMIEVEGLEGPRKLVCPVKHLCFWIGDSNVSALEGGRSFSIASLDQAIDTLANFVKLFARSPLIDAFYQTLHTLNRRPELFGTPTCLHAFNYYVLKYDPFKLQEYLLCEEILGVLEHV